MGSNIFQWGGVQLFSGVCVEGGGVQMLISIETDKTCDFSSPGLPFAGFVHAQAGLRLCFSHALNKVDSVFFKN